MKTFILISPNFDSSIKKYTLSDFYTKAILQSGGIPIITPFENINNIDDMLDGISGLVLSGGGDIHADFFDQQLDDKARYINVFRDEFEIELVKKAIERDIPVLCICRGAQILNVALGGDINQHIENHFEKDNDELSHDINIVCGSYFDKLFNKNSFCVNSIHHQSIKSCAKNIEVLAYCGDTIEAIRLKNKKFVIGVQYHPERIYDNEESKILFDEFIKCCNKR